MDNPTIPEANRETAEEFSRFLQNGALLASAEGKGKGKSLRAWVELAETYRIVQVLRECGGNRSAAARVLGIGRRTLYAKMDKLGISAAWHLNE